MRSIRSLGLAVIWAAALGPTPRADAAFLSELFQSGPAGQAVELSSVDDAQGATLAILNGSRFDSTGFGQVLDVVHLPAGGGWAPTVLITDDPWPGGTIPATPLADLAPASGGSTLNLGGVPLDRLLVVFDGATAIQLGDNPLRDAAAEARYDASAVTDWLAFGPAGLADGYTAAGYDLADINATLGIDLLTRTADRSAGRVFARAPAPGEPLDLSLTWVGDPDVHGEFPVGPGLAYRSTPGLANVPLVTVPEPGTAAVLALPVALGVGRRRRRC